MIIIKVPYVFFTGDKMLSPTYIFFLSLAFLMPFYMHTTVGIYYVVDYLKYLTESPFDPESFIIVGAGMCILSQSSFANMFLFMTKLLYILLLSIGRTVLNCFPFCRRIIFSVHISLIYEHLFFKYFVCWSVGQTQKDRNVKIWKRDFLRL